MRHSSLSLLFGGRPPRLTRRRSRTPQEPTSHSSLSRPSSQRGEPRLPDQRGPPGAGRRAAGRTRQQPRPLTRSSPPSAPDRLLEPSGPARGEASCPERTYTTQLVPLYPSEPPDSPAPRRHLRRARARDWCCPLRPLARPRHLGACSVSLSPHSAHAQNPNAGWGKTPRKWWGGAAPGDACGRRSARGLGAIGFSDSVQSRSLASIFGFPSWRSRKRRGPCSPCWPWPREPRGQGQGVSLF